MELTFANVSPGEIFFINSRFFSAEQMNYVLNQCLLFSILIFQKHVPTYITRTFNYRKTDNQSFHSELISFLPSNLKDVILFKQCNYIEILLQAFQKHRQFVLRVALILLHFYED